MHSNDEHLRELLTELASVPTDEEAWGELYRQMWPFVFAVIYRQLRGTAGSAEDLAQEVLLKLFRARPFARLRDPKSFRAYLARIAQNTTFTYLRQILRTRDLEIYAPNAMDALVEPETIDNHIDSKNTVRHLTQELPPKERELLELLLSGRSISEIAKVLGTTYRTAAVRLYRLRQRLKYNQVIR